MQNLLTDGCDLLLAFCLGARTLQSRLTLGKQRAHLGMRRLERKSRGQNRHGLLIGGHLSRPLDGSRDLFSTFPLEAGLFQLSLSGRVAFAQVPPHVGVR